MTPAIPDPDQLGAAIEAQARHLAERLRDLGWSCIAPPPSRSTFN